MNNNGNEFTKTQQAMINVLSDGKRHRREELHACCGPSLRNTIRFHISKIREKLRPKSEDIVCVAYKNTYWYQHIRLLNNPYDGRI